MPHPNRNFPVLSARDKLLPFYLLGIGLHHEQEHIRRDQGIEDYQWIQCRSGVGKLKLSETEHIVKPGMGMLLFPGQKHEYYALSDSWEVDWIIFDGNGSANLFETVSIVDTCVYTLAQPEYLLSRMRELLQAALTPQEQTLSNYACSAILYTLLTEIIQRVSVEGSDTVGQQYERLKPVLDYIEQHYAEEITLPMLAGLICVTPEYFCHLFKKTTGIRPISYVNQVRVNKSKGLLLDNVQRGMEDIARQVGFESTSYYGAIFKKLERITPGTFRRSYQKS
ncbi:AraC family transcriptional regulator [Paenibacillus xylanexedens]|uniref:AraC family transcriptional regulator n=1 Tax=Paenibacillus xylanexedens TaxID=528191 RepID=UPI001C8D92D0|nr:AraC family transcriptional regulator [Paenibacillus xylanexedens]MBY0119236.1 helix-turn-helix transcriptional regulator [Paenibacillus xylanexedens]